MAINLMKFVRHNSFGFYGKQSLFPFYISFMKYTSGLLTEVTNIMIIVQSETIEDVIKDFIAFGFICEIDNMMISTVTSINCSDEIAKSGIVFPKNQKQQSVSENLTELWNVKELSILWKINNSIQCVIQKNFNMFYKIIYYYFFPSVTVLIVFFY